VGIEDSMKRRITPLIQLIYFPIFTLGPGKRLGIWFQGCTIRCKGCIANHSWEFDPQYKMKWKEIESYLKNEYGKLTISGGEPFDQPEALLKLLKMARKYRYNDILVYSGYTYTVLDKKYPDILYYIDILIDGPFMEKNETSAIWKGSGNQNMYIFNPELKELYESYGLKEKNRSLQFVEGKQGTFVVGIPFQKDTQEIKDAIN